MSVLDHWSAKAATVAGAVGLIWAIGTWKGDRERKDVSHDAGIKVGVTERTVMKGSGAELERMMIEAESELLVQGERDQIVLQILNELSETNRLIREEQGHRETIEQAVQRGVRQRALDELADRGERSKREIFRSSRRAQAEHEAAVAKQQTEIAESRVRLLERRVYELKNGVAP